MNKNKTYFLEDLLTLKYGKDQKKVIDPLGQFPILGTGGIIGYSNTFLYDKPSVLIGRKGTIDKVSFIDVPFWTIDTLFYSEINEELTIPKWLYYRLSLIDFSRYNEATGVPSLKTTTLNKIPITICSLHDQQKIASVLSALDDQIELNNKINQELETLAQTLYNYWFVQFEFPNEEGTPYKSSGGKMVWNEELNQEIPEGWEVKQLGDEFSIKSGYAFSSKDYDNEGLYPLVTIKNINEGIVDCRTDNFIKNIPDRLPDYCRLKVKDILITLTGNVGRMGLVCNKNLLLNQRVGLIDYNESFMHNYAYLMFNSANIQYEMKNLAVGTSQKNLSPLAIESIVNLFPNKKVIKDFHAKTHLLFNEIISNRQQNQELIQLRDDLLPLLMNGQVTVSDDVLD